MFAFASIQCKPFSFSVLCNVVSISNVDKLVKQCVIMINTLCHLVHGDISYRKDNKILASNSFFNLTRLKPQLRTLLSPPQ